METGLPGSPREVVAGATAAPVEPRKPHGVKRHHHKHNLKHRYELQETLGKGTYGKVKRATERFSGRVRLKNRAGKLESGIMKNRRSLRCRLKMQECEGSSAEEGGSGIRSGDPHT